MRTSLSYRMGDVVRKRGRHVFAEGRKKDLINRGGEKISVEEVENLVLREEALRTFQQRGATDPARLDPTCLHVP